MKNLLRPAIAVMANLRFRRKFLVLALLLMVPLAVIVIAETTDAIGALHLASRERDGFLTIRQVLDLTREVRLHRDLSRRDLEGDKSAAVDLKRSATAIAEKLAALDLAIAAHGSLFDPDGSWRGLHDRIAGLDRRPAEELSLANFDRHTGVVKDLTHQVTQLAQAAQLSIDPGRDSYLLADSLVNRLPELLETLEQVRVTGKTAVQQRGADSSQHDFLTVAHFGIDRGVEGIGANLRGASAVNASMKPLVDQFSTMAANIDRVNKYVKDTLIAGADIDLATLPESIKTYVDNSTKAIEATSALTQAEMDQLQDVLDARIARQRIALGATLALALAFGALGLAVLMGFFYSVDTGLQSALESARAVAAGRLDAPTPVSQKDEVGDLLAAMTRVIETLRDFQQAQRELARQHDAGMTSHRIPEESFGGAFREMAHDVNSNLAAHTGVTEEIVTVVKRYAEGDFSDDIRPMQGEMAHVSSSVAGIKSSFASISADVARLVESARAGDFSLRGDPQRYANEFRALIEGMNSLMEVNERSLSDLESVLAAIARGDLTQTISGDYQGAFAQLKDDANQTVERLREIIGRIGGASEAITTAAREIAAGNMDLSSRTEQQATNLEKTAASMAEQTTTIRENAEHASQANELVTSASAVAVRAGSDVARVVQTMQAISESSTKISNIISVIDGIAFQTNILALNAAVEAARAGEQGRGFAVVATEVRSLAQRSAQAAKEIKTLINDSTERVSAGFELANSAGQTMEEVVASVRRVTMIMGEISTASERQSSGIEQVNSAIGDMDQSTQQNAALVEQAAAAASSMREQAEALAEAISIFQTRATPRPRGTPRLATVNPRALIGSARG